LGDVLEDSGLKWKTGEVVISSNKGEDTTSLLLEASTQLAAEGSKVLFVCFQIAINNTAIQLSVKKNELNYNKTAKKAAFAKCKNPTLLHPPPRESCVVRTSAALLVVSTCGHSRCHIG